jgi:L-lactate dehydrogenase complex protein LldG
MSSRDEILARIRTNAAGDKSPQGRKRIVTNRIKGHPAGIIPAGPDSAEDRVRQFASKAKNAAASVAIVAAGGEAAAISKWLRNHNLPQALRMGTDQRLKRIKWPKKTGPELKTGPSDGNDLTGLSHGFAGISESGTLVMVSGAQNPTTINFLPENHIVILDAKDIDGDHEAVWRRIRRKFSAGKMPRTVNMITGPSRSADIEQTLILGAHGPIRLHIIIVRDKA